KPLAGTDDEFRIDASILLAVLAFGIAVDDIATIATNGRLLDQVGAAFTLGIVALGAATLGWFALTCIREELQFLGGRLAKRYSWTCYITFAVLFAVFIAGLPARQSLPTWSQSSEILIGLAVVASWVFVALAGVLVMEASRNLNLARGDSL